ncbi:MAG: leucine-rich repeat domain-containing protein [Clostridia bacterium]|nr:leucine-rich repeat domain-containing protein [Clostridia bacterium]
MKRIISLILCAAVLSMCFSYTFLPPETVLAEAYGDFEYETGDSGITITSYGGSDIEVVVPSQIDGTDVVAIGDYAFMYSAVASITLPSTLITIGESAFQGSELTEVVLPDSVTTVGSMAFFDCTNLASATLSYLVSEIGESVFDGCSEELVIYGYTNSEAETYALNNGITFSSVGDSPSVTQASGICGDDITWTLDNTNTLTITGTGEMSNGGDYNNNFWNDYKAKIKYVVIGEGVTSVMSYAFYNCSVLETVSLPSTLTKIENDAFEQCSALREINFPSSLESIGSWAFYYCSAITKAILPEGLTTLDYSSFANCTALEEAYIPSTVALIDNYAFDNCRKLSKVTINDGLEYIGHGAFSDTAISDIYLPNGLETIETYAFDGCSSLKSVVIPDTVTKLGNAAFRGCSVLETVTISQNITRIESETFSKCTKLSGISLPEKVYIIGEEAFYRCSAITSVTFGDSLAGIGASAFSMSGITSVTIPAGVGKIGEYAFPNANMTKIIGYDDSAAQQYATDNGITFESLGALPDYVVAEGKEGDNISWSISTLGVLKITGTGATDNYSYSSRPPWYEFTVKDIEISEGITAISNYMFVNCSEVEEVTIPSTVKTIGMYAFMYCSSLKTVNMYEGLTEIRTGAFNGCDSLEAVEIPSTVIAINSNEISYSSDAFDSETLKTITGYEGTAAQSFANYIGAEFVSLGEAEELVVYEHTYNTGVTYTFTNTGKLSFSSENEATVGADSWTSFNTIKQVTFGDKITGIGGSMLYNRHELTDIYISPYVTSIDKYAIYNDNGVYSFTIHGYDGTAAEDLAASLGVTFNSLGEAPVIPVDSGTCGENVSWELDTAGVLRLTGTGKIYDYTNPWDNYYRSDIKKIVVGDGINNIPERAFAYEYFAEEIEISYTVLSIEYLPDNITTIRGYDDSAAEIYAQEHGRTFVSLGAAPDAPIMSGTIGTDVQWSVDTAGTLTISGSGEINYSTGYPDYWNFREYVKKLVVEEGITSIAYNNFYGFSSLKEVELADTVTYIGSNVFSYCSALENINLPDGITTIGSNTFTSCTSLTEAVLPASLKTVDSYLYEGCTALSSVTIPDGVYLISTNAFAGCTSLNKVTVPESVTSIYSGAFDTTVTLYGYDETYVQTYAKNNGYTFVSLGRAPLTKEVSGTLGNFEWKISTDGVMTVNGTGDLIITNTYGDYPWEDYKKYVDKLIIGEGITSIGPNAFCDCEYLGSVSLPDSLIAINSYAFDDCYALKEINLPDKLEYVGEYALSDTAITKITVPESVNYFNYVFGYNYPDELVIYGYTGSAAERYAKDEDISFVSIGVLERVVVSEGTCGDNLTWTLDNYGLLLIKGSGKMDDFTTGSTPWQNELVVSVEIADGVESIGNYAFAELHDLTEVSIASSVEVIGQYAFMGSYKLDVVDIPEGTKEIGAYAFSEGVNNVIVPESVTAIGENAFSLVGYDGNVWQTASVYGEEGSYIEEFCISNSLNFGQPSGNGYCGDSITWDFDIRTGILNISGTGAMYNYIEDELSNAPWAKYSEVITEVKLSEGITVIGEGTMNLGLVKEFKLPSTVKSILARAFQYNWEFDKLEIPNGCVEIGEYAFYYCGSLAEIVIPPSVTTIADTAFEECNDTLIVYGASGSAAEQIAELNGFEFVDIYATAEITNVEVTVNDDELEIIVDGEELDNNKTYAVTYAEGGNMLGMYEMNSGCAYAAADDVYTVKILCLESFTSMKPACASVSITKDDFVSESGGSPSSGGGSSGGSSSSGGGMVAVPLG